MKVLFASSEALPFFSSGGLGDVAGSLPKEIKKESGCDIRVVLPYYKSVKAAWGDKIKYLTNYTVTLAWRRLYCGVFYTQLNGITHYFLDNEYYFKRDCSYGDFDDGEKFAFFSKAIMDMMIAINFFPDILHANDWQTSLCIPYLKKIYINDNRFAKIRTVFTIHNIMYQGRFGKEVFEDITGLPAFSKDDLMLDGDINYMKGAIQTTDTVTTVSATYMNELLNGENSHNLDSILRLRKDEFFGIINGIDTEFYNPDNSDDVFPFENNFDKYKERNKLSLQEELSLPKNANIPIISVISRLCEQKGLSIMKVALENTLKYHNIQLVVLGKGEYMEEEFFKYLERIYPDKVRAKILFDKKLSKKIYAGSDILLMPSKTEPCGISQMIACRYGTVPIVRETGGLKDTVICYNPYGKENSCGFSFYDYSSDVLYDTIIRTLELYKKRIEWKELALRGMKKDFSWTNSAKKYIEVYNRL